MDTKDTHGCFGAALTLTLTLNIAQNLTLSLTLTLTLILTPTLTPTSRGKDMTSHGRERSDSLHQGVVDDDNLDVQEWLMRCTYLFFVFFSTVTSDL